MPHRHPIALCRIEAYHSRQRGVFPPSFFSRIIQVASTGTKVVDSTYDEIMAKPTAIDSGTNNCRATPAIKKEGTNTERTHNMASNRGIAVLRQASTTAMARDMPDSFAVSRSEWMFSISTVASSTSTPTAIARPPRVMILLVAPVIHNQTTP